MEKNNLPAAAVSQPPCEIVPHEMIVSAVRKAVALHGGDRWIASYVFTLVWENRAMPVMSIVRSSSAEGTIPDRHPVTMGGLPVQIDPDKDPEYACASLIRGDVIVAQIKTPMPPSYIDALGVLIHTHTHCEACTSEAGCDQHGTGRRGKPQFIADAETQQKIDIAVSRERERRANNLPAAAAGQPPCARESLVTDWNPPVTRIALWAIGIYATDEQAEAVNRLAEYKVSRERERIVSYFVRRTEDTCGYEDGFPLRCVQSIAGEIRAGKDRGCDPPQATTKG